MPQYQVAVLPALPLQKGTLRLRLSSVAFAFAGLFLWFLVFNGPLRYGFARLHLDTLIYLPKVLMLASVVLLPLLRPRASASALTVSAFVGLYFVWGTMNLPSPAQAAFGVWVFTPLLFGLWAGAVAGPEQWCRLFVALFIVAAVGVFLNPLIHYPWTGQTLTLLGKDIKGSWQWTSFGLERYAGFARASFNAAAQLLLFGVMLVVLLKRRGGKLLVWIVAGVGIALTTSKGPLGAWALVSLYFAGGTVLRWPRYWTQVWLSVLTFVLLAMILLPLSTLWIHYDPRLQGFASKALFSSFGARLNWTWPDSLRLLDLHGTYHWWMGRGLGGIGAAQQYFEPAHHLPGDNFFVYVTVMVGVPVALLLFMTWWWQIIRLGWQRDCVDWRLPVIIAVVAYGVVATDVENALFAFFLGMSLSARGNGKQLSFGM